MITFLVCLAILIGGYFVYGSYIDRQFGPDDRKTPAITMSDGVDYVVLPRWRIFLIQLLNIAGLGPIWGAVGGALWGPSVFLWITFGTIFAGAVHDYASGFMSIRHEGKSLSELIGIYMGPKVLTFMRVVTVVLLFMVGVVFSQGPAALIAFLCKSVGLGGIFTQVGAWLLVVMIYYFIATFVPIDAIIGKIYPVFGVSLLIMALGVGMGIFTSGAAANIPELWEVGFSNMHPSALDPWPLLFITVACGAISGFHATQSPLMARCCKSEHQCKSAFYGAMVCEGIIALVWAGAACALFSITGGKMTGLKEAMTMGQAGCVYHICNSTMGTVGAALAMLGVIACPITSGDTAFRSARLIVADWFNIDQSNWRKRMLLTVPLLVLAYAGTHMNYGAIWNYFASVNQILATITLWTVVAYLVKEKKNYWLALIPAIFMTYVVSAFCLRDGLYFGKLWGQYAGMVGNVGGIVVTLICIYLFRRK